MSQKKYSLLPHHESQMVAWRDKWIGHALSTQAMTEDEREICRDAVRRLYIAAGLAPPSPSRIVFAPSPFVTRFAAGFAAWIWYRRRHPATRAATNADTNAATFGATNAATNAATDAATNDATDAATRAATNAATNAAMDYSNWWVMPDGIPTTAAADLGIGQEGFLCASRVWRMYQGGNFWAAEACHLSFFRHIVGLDLDYSAWDAWEKLAIHGSWRVMHADFCIITDRPEILLLDDRNRPHCDTGPFCRWRNGDALYAVHGVYVPAWLIEQPERLTLAAIEIEKNAEIQRVMIEKFGWERYSREGTHTIIDHDERWGTLYGRPGAAEFVRVTNRTPEPDGTCRHYILPVAPQCEPLPAEESGELGEPQSLTALNAVASTFGLTGPEYERILQAET